MVRAIVLGFVLSFSIPASAQTYGLIEARVQVEHDLEPLAAIDALVGHRYGEWGVSAFFMVVDGWAQGYAGPTYAPAEWVELSLNIGAQQTPDGLAFRYAASAWFGYSWFDFLGIVEFDNPAFQGDDLGVWYDLTAVGKVTDWFAAGAKVQRGVGFGPHLKLTEANTGLGLWLSWCPVDLETLDMNPSRFLVGATLSL